MLGDVAVAIAMGGFESSCALVSGGRVLCWGSNENGRLGTGSFDLSNSYTPVNVSLRGGCARPKEKIPYMCKCVCVCVHARDKNLSVRITIQHVNTLDFALTLTLIRKQ